MFASEETLRFEFGHGSSDPIAFFGRYVDVTPPSRLAWTNEESDGGASTTVTFEEEGGKTLLMLHDLYPSQQALKEAIASMEGGVTEQFEQLDELLLALREGVGRW